MNKEKTILFVMPRLPFPASSGRKTSLYHYCRILSEELGYRLVVAAFLENEDEPEDVPSFIDRLVVLSKAPITARLFGIIKNSIILRRMPMQVSLYWSKKAKQEVDDLIKEEKPEIVIGDMVRSTEYIKDADAFRVSDLDDRISLRYQRQLEVDINGINPYGALLSTIPKTLRKFMLLRPIKFAVVKNEIRLLQKYELEMGRIFQCTIFVAGEEAKQFNSELNENKAIAIPIGVDVEYFHYRKTGQTNNYIGFLGAMGVAHNESAIRHFVIDIFPYVLQKQSDAKLLVIGGGVSNDLKKLTSNHVEFIGRVDDVRVYLEKCKIFVCPMTFGSGIKTKNLEAMSMGLPVVTTTIGAENINATQNLEWIIADDNKEFAEAILNLLGNEQKRQEMGIKASEFIKNNFTWDVAKNEWKRLLENYDITE